MPRVKNFVSLRNFLSFMFYLIFFSIAIKQTIDVCVIYFNYSVVPELLMSIPMKLKAPGVSMCIRYSDIFDTRRYAMDNNRTDVPDTSSLITEDIRKLESMVTIVDVFNYTPPINNFVNECRIREPGSYHSKNYFGKHCDDYFEIEKFYIGEFLCYRFSSKTTVDKTYYFRNLAYALTYPRMFYKIYFNISTLQSAHFMKIIVHENFEYPYRSTGFANSFFRG